MHIAENHSMGALGSFISNLPIGLLLLDEESCVKSLNPAAENIFGLGPDEIVGKRITHWVPTLSLEGYSNSNQNISNSRELVGYRKDGSRLDLDVSICEAIHEGKKSFVCLAQNITDRKVLKDVLHKLSIITDRVPSSVLITDSKGRIEFANPCFLKTSGYSLEEIIGNTPRILKSGAHPPRFYQNLWATLSSGREWTGEFCNKKKDGTLVHEMQTILPVKDSGGNVTHFISVKIDDTERKRAEIQLKSYAGKLEQVNQELSDFTSIASHDLQEPLRKIILMGDRLENYLDPLVAEQGKDYLARMQKCATRMQDLISGLLEYGKVTSKAREFEPVDINVVVSEVIEDLEYRIKLTKAEIYMKELPVIEADKLQMRQLFQNLISNALKFRRDDVAPVIKISGSSFVKGYGEIIVEDNGIGFDMQYLGRIFKPFQRLHGKDMFPGSGIGLAICQKIVARHEGTIAAKSAPGKGSTFSILLPDRQQKKDEIAVGTFPKALGTELDWEKLMVKNSPTAMMFADKNFILKHMNPKAELDFKPMEQHLGHSLQSLVGTSILSFHRTSKTVLKILSEPRNLPYTFQLHVGSQLLELTANSAHDGYGDFIGYMVVWRVLEDPDNDTRRPGE